MNTGREGEDGRKRESSTDIYMYIFTYIYIYIYVYTLSCVKRDNYWEAAI